MCLCQFFSYTRKSSCGKSQEAYGPCHNLSKHNVSQMGGGGVPHPVMARVPPRRDLGPVEVLLNGDGVPLGKVMWPAKVLWDGHGVAPWVWTDTQTENTTFPYPPDTDGKKWARTLTRTEQEPFTKYRPRSPRIPWLCSLQYLMFVLTSNPTIKCKSTAQE